MVKVEVLESNIPFILDNGLGEKLDFKDFNEISKSMESGEYIKYSLFDKEGIPFYQGTFEKVDSNSAEIDLKEKLALLRKKKMIKRKEYTSIISLINDALVFKKEEVQLTESLPQQIEQKNIEQNEIQSRLTSKKKSRFSSILKKIVIVCSFLLITGGLFTGGFFLWKNYIVNSVSSTNEVVEGSLEEMLKDGSYFAAAKKYPESIVEIEESIVKAEDFTTLSSFQKEFPTDVGTFDLAFHNKEWKQVADSKLKTFTKERRAMLGYAFVQLDRIDEAKIINKEIDSPMLSESIENSYLKTGLGYLHSGDIEKAETLQKEIESDKLEEYITEAKTYIKLIALYESKKETDNATHWREVLKNLGEEELNE